jgi:hypothetical protein
MKRSYKQYPKAFKEEAVQRELTTLLKCLTQRITRALVRQGLLVIDEEVTYLAEPNLLDDGEERLVGSDCSTIRQRVNSLDISRQHLASA